MSKDFYLVLCSLVSSFIYMFFGTSVSLLYILLICIIFDYVTGIIKSVITKSINSQKGFKGIFKKVLILIIVSMSHFIDIAMNSDIIMTITSTFFIGNECISILENSAKCGIKYPTKLLDILEQLKGE